MNQTVLDVTNEETRIAIEVGEPARFGHGGEVFKVKDPTSHSVSLQLGIWEEFSPGAGSSIDSVQRDIEDLLKIIVEIQ